MSLAAPASPEPPRALHVEDLQFERDLVALRVDEDGQPKPESPSSLETLMVSRLAWLLRRLEAEPLEWAPEAANPALLGTVAHEVFEGLFAPGVDLPTREEIPERVEAALDDVLKRIAPFLRASQWTVERRHFTAQTIKAAQAWRDTIEQLGAEVVAAEEWLAGRWSDIAVHGQTDLILGLPGNRLLVVDYKRSSSRKRLTQMQKGFDSQASLYRAMLASGGPKNHDKTELAARLRAAAETGIVYYLMNDQVALSDSALPGATAIPTWRTVDGDIAGQALALIERRLSGGARRHAAAQSRERPRVLREGGGHYAVRARRESAHRERTCCRMRRGAMSLPKLTLIPAGAGSGKTHSIQEKLGEWVAAGKVAPERIIAVTFTEAAAAELKERIGSKLLAMGRVEDALRLDQAYISTIHGFGLRILTEFAFESGTSPQPRLLNEDEQNALIRLAAARTEQANEIASNLAAYGYVFVFGAEKTPEDMFREDLLKIVELLRSVGWRSYSDEYAAQAAAFIAERYGPVGDGAQLSAALRQSVETLLRQFPDSLASQYGSSKTAADALQKDFGNLSAARKRNALESDWGLWQKLRKLRQSMRGSALPAPYDDLSSDVMSAADALPTHPGPLAHARRHIEALLAAGQEVLVHYETAKREAGLVDYSDMIALAGRLLRERPDVLETLVGRVDCLVVDEFQDTNPLQFALVWQLAAAGVPTVVVGDLKQAIMGFQGADPRLFEALAEQNPAEPASRSRRTGARSHG